MYDKVGVTCRKLQSFPGKPRPMNETRKGVRIKKGNTRYRGRRVNNERPREGLLVVLVDHSTDGFIVVTVKVGNRCPRDPL